MAVHTCSPSTTVRTSSVWTSFHRQPRCACQAFTVGPPYRPNPLAAQRDLPDGPRWTPSILRPATPAHLRVAAPHEPFAV